jgi:hypothetical protein
MTVLGKIVRKVSAAADIVRASLRGSERVDSIEVYGREEFRSSIRKALLLLHDNNLPAWDTLTRFVSAIIEGSRTAVIVTAHPALMLVDGPHARQIPEFLAGTITHMACSCQLHRTYEAEFPGRRVPRNIYADRAAQERCDSAYDECLLALGKDPKHIRNRRSPDPE